MKGYILGGPSSIEALRLVAVAYSIRPWNDTDAGIDREISRAVYPEYVENPRHPAWFPARQLGAPGECSTRYVVMESGKNHRVAYAALWELRPGRYRFDLAVRPEWQKQGIGAELLTRIIQDAHQLGATGLQARVRDDQPVAIEFIHRRGFHESHRMGAFRIDFAGADFSSLEQAAVQLQRRDIDVTNLASLREQDHEYLERFYELYSAAREGWPDPDPDPSGPDTVPMELLKGWLDQAQLPEAFFVARHGSRYVAFSSFFSIGTAVHPEYRRRGIATSLKAISIADGQRRGFEGQTTSTASPGMRKVFEKLGYKCLWSEIRLIRPMA